MRIAIGNDHSAVALKQHIQTYLEQKGYEIYNVGTDSTQRTDYPVYGQAVAKEVISGRCELGILICGTGVGISLAANKIHGIRAAVCSEPYSARLSRQHNNANIIAFGARVVGESLAEMIVDEFLAAEYEGGRHQKRIDMISALEEGEAICTE